MIDKEETKNSNISSSSNEDHIQEKLNEESLEAKQESLQLEINEWKEKFIRAHADIENIRKRSKEEISKAYKFSIESFAESLLPIKDSLEKALDSEQSINTLRQGVEMTLRQLSSVFERNQIEEVLPKQGDKFDPNLHHAISSLKSDQEVNTIIETLQKGYLISNRSLRPALVTVTAPFEE